MWVFCFGSYLNHWSEYQSAFAELGSSVAEISLELQFGDGAEEWIVHSEIADASARFLQLSAQAGALLPEVHLSNHETGSVIAPETRWFRLLRERNSPYLTSPVVIDQAGVALSRWTLDLAADCSCQLCLELQQTHPLEKSGNWLSRKIASDPIGLLFVVFGAALLMLLLARLLSK